MGDTKYLSIESISKENTGGKVTLTASLCSSAGIRADLWYSFDREFDDAVCVTAATPSLPRFCWPP